MINKKDLQFEIDLLKRKVDSLQSILFSDKRNNPDISKLEKEIAWLKQIIIESGIIEEVDDSNIVWEDRSFTILGETFENKTPYLVNTVAVK